jgi:exosortase
MPLKLSKSIAPPPNAPGSGGREAAPVAPATAPPDGGAGARSFDRRSLLILAGLAGATLWAYWPVLVEMARKWTSDPQYSHAYLVPLFSLYLLWSRRGPAGPAAWRPSWWGLPLLAAGVGLRAAGAYWFFDWLEAVSLLPVLAGAVWLLAGWPALRRAWPAIGFLAFMIPLPFKVETALSQPLQRVATLASTYALQTIGLPAAAEGNVITINEARIGVVEACNGLGMLLLFFALATAVAMLSRRSLLERVVIVASAVPIAVAANVARITVTGLLHVTVGARWADVVFHDLAGWLMMPLALGLLWLELRVLARLFVEVERPTGPRRLVPGGPAQAAGRPAKPRSGRSATRAPAGPAERFDKAALQQPAAVPSPTGTDK